MKRWAVAILAVGVLSGCGMGVDELPPPGDEGVATSSAQALEGADTAEVVGAPTAMPSETPANTAPSNPRDPGVVALPQDPIPLFDGKPLPPGGPMPAMGPLEGPGPTGPVLPTR